MDCVDGLGVPRTVLADTVSLVIPRSSGGPPAKRHLDGLSGYYRWIDESDSYLESYLWRADRAGKVGELRSCCETSRSG